MKRKLIVKSGAKATVTQMGIREREDVAADH